MGGSLQGRRQRGDKMPKDPLDYSSQNGNLYILLRQEGKGG